MRLTLEPGGDIVALVRAARPASADSLPDSPSDSLVVVVAPSSDTLWLAMTRAAIGPLAIDRAPATRVNAVFAAQGAAEAHVDAAVDFLGCARSTTGQVIDVRAEQAG